jgi:hypothetical protein
MRKGMKKGKAAAVALKWTASSGKLIHLPSPPRQSTPDYAVFHATSGDPYLVVEVAWSQTMKDVTQKITDYFVLPSVVAGVVIKIDETPQYKRPAIEDFKEVLETSWTAAAQDQATVCQPIKVEGVTWVHKTTCTLLLYFRSEDGSGELQYQEVGDFYSPPAE